MPVLNKERTTRGLRLLRKMAAGAFLAAAGILAFGAPAQANNDVVYVSANKNASIKVPEYVTTSPRVRRTASHAAPTA